MANRRMFSKVITNSDLFLNMPASTQLLYFHLGMNADDDGFVQLRSTMKTIGASEDDARLLFEKELLILCNDGVVVIRDWLVHNEIRADRYKPTYYQTQKNELYITDSKQYSLVVPNDNHLRTQVRLGKVRLGKNNTNVPVDTGTRLSNNWKPEYGVKYIDGFNSLFNTHYRLTPTRITKLKLRFKTYTSDQISTALVMLSKSKFHQGDNDRGWKADPDFLIKSDEQVDKWLNKGGRDEHSEGTPEEKAFIARLEGRKESL